MLVNFVTEYLFCRFFVYRHSLDTRLARQGAEEALAQPPDGEGPGLAGG